MQGIESAPQMELGGEEMLAGQGGASGAMLAVRRVRDLERAVGALRLALAAMPAGEAGGPEQREKIARLLCEVALFRIALADKTT